MSSKFTDTIKRVLSSWKVIVGVVIVVGGVILLLVNPNQATTVIDLGKTYLLKFFKRKLTDNEIKDNELKDLLIVNNHNLGESEKKIESLLDKI